MRGFGPMTVMGKGISCWRTAVVSERGNRFVGVSVPLVPRVIGNRKYPKMESAKSSKRIIFLKNSNPLQRNSHSF